MSRTILAKEEVSGGAEYDITCRLLTPRTSGDWAAGATIAQT